MDLTAFILIAGGAIAILADLHLTQVGVPGGVGVLAMAAGLVMLLASSLPAWLAVLSGAAVAAAGLLSVIQLVATVRRAARSIPKDPVSGREAVVKRALTPVGLVAVEGILWQAESPLGFVAEGATVLVTGRQGFRLTVVDLSGVLFPAPAPAAGAT
ncbi:MAG: NfeD family protein [Candidatus Dormibacterales bacterium]